MLDRSLVFLDLETTGATASFDRITEIGVIEIKRCRGVCAGKESRVRHDLRLTEALSGLKLQAWPFKGRIGVREASGRRTDLHVLDHWCYLGTVRAEHELHALDAKPVFDLDTYKILKRFLAGAGNAIEIVPIGG